MKQWLQEAGVLENLSTRISEIDWLPEAWPAKDARKGEPTAVVVSIDIKTANYSCLSLLDVRIFLKNFLRRIFL